MEHLRQTLDLGTHLLPRSAYVLQDQGWNAIMRRETTCNKDMQ